MDRLDRYKPVIQVVTAFFYFLDAGGEEHEENRNPEQKQNEQ